MPLELQRQTVKNLEEAYKRAAANGDFERYAELKQKYDILLPLILRDDDVAS
jgi:excinuclease UvrABC nuclease subunit